MDEHTLRAIEAIAEIPKQDGPVAGVLQRTLEVIREIEEIVGAIDEVDSVFAVLGISFSDRGLRTPTDPATIGQMTLELKPADVREEAGGRKSTEIVTEIRRRTSGIAGATRIAVAGRGGGPGGADVLIRVRGDDLETVGRAVTHIRDELGRHAGVFQIEDVNQIFC